MQRLTKWVIVASTVLLATYDLIPVIRKGPGDSISEVMRDAARRYPIIAFAAGLLVGHWWWTPGGPR